MARQIGAVVGASGLAGLSLAASGSWIVPFMLIAMGALLVLGFTHPALFLGLVVVTRPMLDDFSNSHGLPGIQAANFSGVIALLVVALLVVYATTSREIHLPRATFPLGLVVAITAAGAPYAMLTLGGEVGMEPISEVARIGALLAMYVLAANLFTTTDRAQRLFAIVGLSAVVPAIVGIVQWVTTGGRYEYGLDVLRITGTFVGPNPFGAYLALGALILIMLPTALPVLVRYPAIALILTALIGTYSREGWVIFLLGMVLMGWRRRPGLILAVCAAAVAMVFTIPSIHDRVLTSKTRDANQKAFTSFDWRLTNWEGLLAKWGESPVVGFGTDSTPYVNPKKNEFQLSGVRFAPGQISGYAAHNLGVKALVEGGLVLLLGYIALFTSLVGSSLRMAREHWPLARHALLLCILWSITAIVGLASDDPTTNTPLMFSLVALLGCLEGASRAARPEAKTAAAR